MNAVVPTALAVVGTSLAAFAAFGPFRPKPSTFAHPAPANPAGAASNTGGATLNASGAAPTWPTLVEPTAIACDARVRIDLAEALGRLQSPWSESILREAQATEPDPMVRTIIDSALSRPCEVTLSLSKGSATRAT